MRIVFEILGAIGSLSTFGAFLYLFRRDKDKQTQIDKLTEMVVIMEDQKRIDSLKLRLSVHPDIYKGSSTFDRQNRMTGVTIHNRGEIALGLSAYPVTDNIKLEKPHGQNDLDKGQSVKIEFKFLGNTPINEYKYMFEIKYFDRIQNEYILKFSGVGHILKLIEKESFL